MTIIKAKIFGQSVVGVYLAANNSFILHPKGILEPLLEKFLDVFDEPFYPCTINNSNLLGVYTASNKYGIIVPHLIREDELNDLKSFVNGSTQIGILKSIDNAFGNLILCNDKGAIVSSFLKAHRNEIEEILNVETVVYDFANYYLPGSISLTNNKGCLVHPLSTDDEVDYIASILKVKEVDVSTVNRGIPYLNSGAIVNDKNGIFGEDCTGPELMRLTSVLNL